MDRPTLQNKIKKNLILFAEILLVTGLLLALLTLLNPMPILYLVFFSAGHVLIIAGLILYIMAVWIDLKKHDVL